MVSPLTTHCALDDTLSRNNIPRLSSTKSMKNLSVKPRESCKSVHKEPRSAALKGKERYLSSLNLTYTSSQKKVSKRLVSPVVMKDIKLLDNDNSSSDPLDMDADIVYSQEKGTLSIFRLTINACRNRKRNRHGLHTKKKCQTTEKGFQQELHAQ